MSSAEKAREFAALHVPGKPLILFNVWDAGSARAVTEAEALALATGSLSVAASQGYPDGEALPFERLLTVAEQIASVTELPLSVDFESGFAYDAQTLTDNVRRLLATGAVGINVEDQKMGTAPQGDLYALHSLDDQDVRLRTIRAAAGAAGVPLFINARTDLALRESDRTKHADLTEAILERGHAYAEAGASGFFVPGLADIALIARIAAASPLPLNIMARPDSPSPQALAEVGVARISHGPFPYWRAMAQVTEWAREAMAPSGKRPDAANS